ncbi:MAG: hypothetical protein NW241_12770 [Bacteroidia bacterium]|nr:hypothetical protein [Bacteroidia bacterium]
MKAQQPTGALPAGPDTGDAAALEAQLRHALEPRPQSRAGLLAGLASGAATLALGWAAGAWVLRSPLTALGAAVLVLSLAGLHAVWFRLALGRGLQHFHLSSRPFLDAALHALRLRQRLLAWLPACLFGMMLGFNLLCLDLLDPAALGLRIAAHLGTNVLLAGAGWLVFRLRLRRRWTQTGALIEGLERVRRQLDA